MYASRSVFISRVILASTLAMALTLAGCKTSSAPATDDASLTAALQSRIASDGVLSTESIQSSVQKQIATLNGTVSSEAARSLASADAAQVAGIKTIVNNLTVQTPAPVETAKATPPPPIVGAPKATKTPTPKPRPAPKATPKPAPIVRQNAPAEPPAPAPQTPEPLPPVAQAVPATPPPPPPPTFRNITLSPDTTIPIRITQTLDSASAQQGDSFSGTIASDIVADGIVVIPHGTPVAGRIVAVQEAAHYKGSSLLTVELTSIDRRGQRLTVNTDPYTVQGKGRGTNTAEKVGGGAAVGAILGGIFGGGKGAAIGAAAGGGVGAGANTVTRGEQVQIPSESLIRFNLTNTLTLKVPGGGDTESPTPTLQQHPAEPQQQ